MVAFGEYEDDGTASAMKARDYKDATDLVAHSLRPEGFDASEDGTGRGTPIVPVAYDLHQVTSPKSCQRRGLGDPRHTLAKENAGKVTIAFDRYNQTETGDVAQTLCSRGNDQGGTAHLAPHLASAWGVRRLTPRECERLQGFPDDFTMIPWRGKPAEQCPDGPRYKALGNSFAVNVITWIGERIEAVRSIENANVE
jgi:DNA (cytosine-5)-methyltransferase 1